jgi:hypothetical protein
VVAAVAVERAVRNEDLDVVRQVFDRFVDVAGGPGGEAYGSESGGLAVTAPRAPTPGPRRQSASTRRLWLDLRRPSILLLVY